MEGPRDLSRLLRPKSIAVVGGGAWCQQVVRQSLGMGFEGDIFRIHPRPDPVEGVAAVPSLSDLPYPPDAVFLGVNRHATLDAVAALSAMGAGGAVCFASGFSEAAAEDASGSGLQSDLIAAAGEMPILGPNCYGFVNALDGALLWPDQHGCAPVERGVAILTQSSNIAINLTMQQRGLPIAFAITCGNMAQTGQAEIALALLNDPRITAIGLHVEGFGDTFLWHALALKAHARGIPLVALKVGASEQARQATVSHTASLAGSDAGADALLRHLGIARVHDLPTFLETLMLLHCNGPLEAPTLSSISCSGGEASLVADTAEGHAVSFPPLTEAQRKALSSVLGPMVALSNPLDYNTYIWGNVDKMTRAWLPMAAAHIGLVLIVLDYPHTDARAWEGATQAAIAVRRESGRPVAVVTTLPELLQADVTAQLQVAGVTPLRGLREAIAAAAAAAQIGKPKAAPPLGVAPEGATEVISEAAAKARLQQHGVAVPRGAVTRRETLAEQATLLTAPLVLKAEGLAHKSEAGAVKLGLTQDALPRAAQGMAGDRFLVEEMVQGAVAELLVGVTRDAAHGYVLTLAAGGVLTELLQDRVSLLLPASAQDVMAALRSLRLYPVLEGYRGAAAAYIPAILQTIMAVQDYVIADAAYLHEIEINPLICTPDHAVAADALISRRIGPIEGETNDGPG